MKLLTKTLALTTLALGLTNLSMADTQSTNTNSTNQQTTATATAPTAAEFNQVIGNISNNLYLQLNSEFGLTNAQIDQIAKDLMTLSQGGQVQQADKDLFTKVMTYLAQKRQAEVLQELEKMSKANLEEGKVAYDKFVKEAGVEKTTSGVAYKITKKGTGEAIKSGETVDIVYTGKLVNGHVFDSNVDSGKPTPFPLSGIIPGLRDALLKAHVGDSMTIFIPSELAYGTQGIPGVIPPSSSLIFEVQVMSVVPADKK